MDATLPITDRTRINRLDKRQVTERAALAAILDAGLIAHVAAVVDGHPVVLPCGYARDGDRVLLHGSTGAGLLRAATGDVTVAIGVTMLDGLVYARSMFDSSMNYRSVVIFGRAARVPDEEKVEALRLISERLMPGRWDEVRPATKRELAATLVLAVPLAEASVKVRDDGPDDSAEPAPDLGVWAGVLPLRVQVGEPVPAADVPPGVPLPASLRAAADRLSSSGV